MYLERVEAVLGPDWGTHIDGQQLKSDGDSFKVKLNATPLFEEWKKKVIKRLLINGQLIVIVGGVKATRSSRPYI